MARSISKISKELESIVDEMKDLAKKYSTCKADERPKIVEKLKSLTQTKKSLERELERGVVDLDKDAELQIDEIRKIIRMIISEELNTTKYKIKKNK